jgi:hypothetical protein
MFNRIHTSFHLQQPDQSIFPGRPTQTLPKVLLAPSHNARPTFFLALALPTPLPKPSKAEKQAEGKSGFVPVAARWVVERSNAWMERCKSLVKNFEKTLENATAKVNLCFVRLMLKRLALN